MPPYVLGINASHHGSAYLLDGERIVAAVLEERLTRRKRHRIYGADPALCIQYCLETAGIRAGNLDMVVVAPQKGLHDTRHDPYSNPLLRLGVNDVPAAMISHHLAHAISAYATSGAVEAAVIVVDGVGSYWEDLSPTEVTADLKGSPRGQETFSMYVASPRKMRAVEKHVAQPDQWLGREAWRYSAARRMPSFQSLDCMYSAVAAQIFGDMDDAGKVMGLASYGKATIPVDEFYRIEDDTFDFSDRVPERFLTGERWPCRCRDYENLAASAQSALEEGLLFLVRRLRGLFDGPQLCLSGGLVLNCVTNQRVIEEGGFSDVYIVPAADDGGACIGAAYYGSWLLGGARRPIKLRSDGLGRSYSPKEIGSAIQAAPAIVAHAPDKLVSEVVDLLCSDKVVGWFQGRSELGPRALGNRSILCDPRRANTSELLNTKVKHRERFRPFAPAILSTEISSWFESRNTPPTSPFMLRALQWKADAASSVPAVVHVDNTGRVQTVSKDDDPLFFELLSEFYRRTGVPILLNTSFNVRGEPIVEAPHDALWALLFTGIDLLRHRGPDCTPTPGVRVGSSSLPSSGRCRSLVRSRRFVRA